MGQTISQKILSNKSGMEKVRESQLVTCKIDKVMATDITAPLSIEVFVKMGAKRVFNPKACILINDHFVPAKDIKAAEFSKAMREFALEQEIEAYFEVGRSGICHSLMGEMALVLPGELVVGADSHTCTAGALGCFATGVGSTDLAAAWALGKLWFRVPETIRIDITGNPSPFVFAKDVILKIIKELGVDGARYKAIEFHGDYIQNMQMSGRFTICNMAIEAGAKTGIIETDDITVKHVSKAQKNNFEVVHSDQDAHYETKMEIDISSLRPQVAEPFLPSLVKDIEDIKEIKIHQAFIGSCTNGSIEDLREAAKVIKGRNVAKGVRLIITPGTQSCYLEACREGLIEIFIEAGAAVTTPTCGACLGGHMGVLAKGEVAIATTNRNFKGRMGHMESLVYLANPAVVAASAVTGKITNPEKLKGA